MSSHESSKRESYSNSGNRSTSRQPGGRDYSDYAQAYDPEWAEAERSTTTLRRRPKPSKPAPPSVAALVEEASVLDDHFQTTYQPARFEKDWLLSSLRPFYELNLVADVLAIVKGGKEANVYRCRGGAAAGAELVAAKVYRPRQFRNLRNDRIYREGREVLAADGKVVKKNDHRTMRALGKKTDFGVQVAHTSWLMYEYMTLQQLHAARAAVPVPLAVAENALIMGYCGDAQRAAPTLHEVSLPLPLARTLFDEVVRNLEIMLAVNLIHGDLSAYNILYWQESITLIDFPQVTDAVANSNARFILNRDVQRVCDYFAQQGVSVNPRGLAAHLWQRFQARSENEIQADLSRTLAALSPDEE